MAYEVTASRKRPKTFDHLVGQEFVVATLKNSLVSGRIAHAYLFSGPRGVGKTSAARILARALNCPGGLSAEACLDYPGSEEIARGTAMDVIEIDGASNTSVNDIRAIKDEVLFPPQSARFKIYIIDEVHMLSNSAFNALLKTIEEPPPYIIFIFATTEIHKVPATIRSRCQQFSFRLIPLEQIRNLLAEACDEMGVEGDSEALTWIAKEATGSLRDAYTLFDQVVSFAEGRITIEKIREKLGLIGLDRVNEFAEVLAQGQGSRALEELDTILASGISIEQFITDLSDYFRSILFLKHGINRENLLGASADRFSTLVQDRLSSTQVERLLELLLQVYRNIRYSLNPRFDIEVFVSKASTITEYITMEDALRTLSGIKKQIIQDQVSHHTQTSDLSSNEIKHSKEANVSAAPDSRVSEPADLPVDHSMTEEETVTSETSSQPQADAAFTETEPQEPSGSYEEPIPHTPEPSINPDIISETHQREVLEAVRHENMTLASTLSKALEWRLEGDNLVFSFETGYFANVVKQQIPLIKQYVDKLLMPGLTIRVQVQPQEKGDYQGQDPNVQRVQEIFRGEILEDSEVTNESNGSL